MNKEDLAFATIGQLAPLIQRRELSPVELTEVILERIERHNGKLLAYIRVLVDRALGVARAAETAIVAGQYLGPLHGIPLALKDLVDTAGISTTGGAKLLCSRVPKVSATVAERLERAGVVLVGKTNMCEFALGPEGFNEHFGMPRNPWRENGLPGGSSSGSGVAVAAGLATAALGSDTGGSVRIPAALCGIVGLKPTFGRVSNFGVMPLSFSLDSVGPMARSVEDVALIFAAMAGPDSRDPNTLAAPPLPWTGFGPLTGELKGRKLAITREMVERCTHMDVRGCFHQAVDLLNEAGAMVEEISLPELMEGKDLMMAVTRPEAYLATREIVEGHWEEVSEHTRVSLLDGKEKPAYAYIKAQRRRQELSLRIQQRMARYDALIFPTTVLPTLDEEGYRKERMLYSELTRPANAFGLCAITVPGGFTQEGLPVGLQVVGEPFDEATILDIARGYEERTNWGRRRPLLVVQ